MTHGNDFAFNDTATRLKETSPEKIRADNPPLTKREYFAAMAMQGLVSKAACDSDATREILSYRSVAIADALIEALNK